MTRWQTRSEMVTKNLPMQRVFRVVDGVEEVDVRIFATQEEALAAARERKPDADLVYITETEEYVPRVWYDRVIDGLQEACDDECAGCYEGYLDDASERDKEALGDMLTATFVQWAKEHGIKYSREEFRRGSSVRGKRFCASRNGLRSSDACQKN